MYPAKATETQQMNRQYTVECHRVISIVFVYVKSNQPVAVRYRINQVYRMEV